jgi:cytidine deaminase
MSGDGGLTHDERQRLFDAATRVREHAYAQYSGFLVGAALLDGQGRIFTGCNVENASFGLTICAERAAAFSAVSQGSRSFRALAVATSGGHAPCGACRQVLIEFGDELDVFLLNIDAPHDFHRVRLSELLPDSFRLLRSESDDGRVE